MNPPSRAIRARAAIKRQGRPSVRATAAFNCHRYRHIWHGLIRHQLARQQLHIIRFGGLGNWARH
eukprot:scaffold273796_cov31-Tisochrysis_lutea.AAC.6